MDALKKEAKKYDFAQVVKNFQEMLEIQKARGIIFDENEQNEIMQFLQLYGYNSVFNKNILEIKNDKYVKNYKWIDIKNFLLVQELLKSYFLTDYVLVEEYIKNGFINYFVKEYNISNLTNDMLDKINNFLGIKKVDNNMHLPNILHNLQKNIDKQIPFFQIVFEMNLQEIHTLINFFNNQKYNLSKFYKNLHFNDLNTLNNFYWFNLIFSNISCS